MMLMLMPVPVLLLCFPSLPLYLLDCVSWIVVLVDEAVAESGVWKWLLMV
jgi:hypothetical protein